MLCLWFIHLELPGYISHLALLLGTPDRVIIRKDPYVLLLSLYIYKHIKRSQTYVISTKISQLPHASFTPQHPKVQSSARISLILRRSRTGTVWFYTSTNNKRAARPKLYTESLTRDLKLMCSRLTLVRISIKLQAPCVLYIGTGVSLLFRERFLYI